MSDPAPPATPPATPPTDPPATPPVTPPADPPAAPQPPSLLNPDGSLAENWASILGDEFAPHADQLAQFKHVSGLAKSYVHLRSHGPAYPDEGAAPEDVTRFHALARVPVDGTLEAYGIQVPEAASPEDRKVYETLAKVAHENHLSGPGFAAVVKEYQRLQSEQIAEIQGRIDQARQAAKDELVTSWRGDFSQNASIVRHLTATLAGQVGVPPDSPHLAALADNPAFAKIMLEVSKLRAEDGIRTPAGFGDLRSPMEQANAIMDGTDPVWGKKYREGSDEERRAAYARVSDLLQQARK